MDSSARFFVFFPVANSSINAIKSILLPKLIYKLVTTLLLVYLKAVLQKKIKIKVNFTKTTHHLILTFYTVSVKPVQIILPSGRQVHCLQPGYHYQIYKENKMNIYVGNLAPECRGSRPEHSLFPAREGRKC